LSPIWANCILSSQRKTSHQQWVEYHGVCKMAVSLATTWSTETHPYWVVKLNCSVA
jgi:hypothetical protein